MAKRKLLRRKPGQEKRKLLKRKVKEVPVLETVSDVSVEEITDTDPLEDLFSQQVEEDKQYLPPDAQPLEAETPPVELEEELVQLPVECREIESMALRNFLKEFADQSLAIDTIYDAVAMAWGHGSQAEIHATVLQLRRKHVLVDEGKREGPTPVLKVVHAG